MSLTIGGSGPLSNHKVAVHCGNSHTRKPKLIMLNSIISLYSQTTLTHTQSYTTNKLLARTTHRMSCPDTVEG